MFKLITCIATEDKAHEAINSIDKAFGIQAATNHFARGLGRSSTAQAMQGLGQQVEKITFSVLVPASQVDELFDFIYHAADLHRPHGGIIYVTAIKQAKLSPYLEKDSTLEA